MTGNTFGRLFRVTTAGESYSGAFRKSGSREPGLSGGITAIIDGVPPGLKIREEDIWLELEKRRPGRSPIDTGRSEKDIAYILSGVMEDDMSTGAPVTLYIPNTDMEDDQIARHGSNKFIIRPGQASYTYHKKYGEYADWYGAGRASGRETAARVAAGAVARLVLDRLGIDVVAFVSSVYDIKSRALTYEEVKSNYGINHINCPDHEAAKRMIEEIIKAKSEGDTLGGTVEVIVRGAPPGLGEPVFDKLDAMLSHALMSIGAVKGIEIGKGFEMALMKGSEANDTPYVEKGSNRVSYKSNNAGGILGGISNGEEIRIRLAVKPTPTIAKKQMTVDVAKMENVETAFMTRNDPCICSRIWPVCEAMTRITLLDAIMVAGGYESLRER